MALSEYKEKKARPKKRRTRPMVAGVALILLMVAALGYYDTRGVTSNTVDCFVGEYLLFPAVTVISQSTSNVTETMTTAISYTTTVGHHALVGSTTANSTSTTNAAGDPTGVETICKYISNTYSSSSSSSST